ncbi:MAG: c-type cytochrome biogenesis protein CcmI, partial [Betaproteobacteria bacterium]|nr:c-type cytochrome biogenesis protein CcmI [Betaproteobacteria bacterium]
MSVFIALAVLGLAVAAGILLPRLLGRHVDAAAAAEVATADNIAAGREQMRILRSRAAAGEISGDEYEEYSREIEEQLARDLEQARAISTGQVKADDSGSRDWSGAAIVVTTLVLVPTIMYLIVGSPQLIDEERSTPAVAGAAPGMDEIEQRLRRMLAENPDESVEVLRLMGVNWHCADPIFP